MTMNIIITMAGLGSRFRAVGYTVPKYEIEVRGHTLFHWSVSSLDNFVNPGSRFIFVCLRESQAGRFIESEVKKLGIDNWEIVEIDQLTDGQATSASLAAPAVKDKSAPMVIYNIDTHVDAEYLHPSHFAGDGWIPCFEGPGDAWSFVRIGDNGNAVEVREKERISPSATIGLYGFSSFYLYEKTYHEFFADQDNVVKGERYIAPMYNHLIQQDKRISISLVPFAAVHALGTPMDVDRFRQQAE